MNYIDELNVELGDYLVHKSGIQGNCVDISDNIITVENIYNNHQIMDHFKNFLVLKNGRI